MAENADGVTPFQGRAIVAPPERAPSPPPTKEKAQAGKYDEIGIAHKPSTTYSTSLLLASREAEAGSPRHFFTASHGFFILGRGRLKKNYQTNPIYI